MKLQIDRLLAKLPLEDCLLVGIFGSCARNFSAPEDVDVLIVCRRGTKEKFEEIAREPPLDISIVDEEELPRLDPVFLYSVERDLRVLFGDPEILRRCAPPPQRVMDELIKNVSYYLRRVIEGYKRGEYEKAVLLCARNAIKYAIWLISVKNGDNISSNPQELLRISLKYLDRRLVDLLQSTPLLREFNDIINEGLFREAVEATVKFVEEVITLSRRPLEEAREWLEHVKKRLAEEALNIRTIRELCQDLFLAVYEVVREYLATHIGRLPETHSEIFHELKRLENIDTLARDLYAIYEDAFNTLHVDCHYKGIGDENLIVRWIEKVEELIRKVSSKV